jgi:hypothetical protein
VRGDRKCSGPAGHLRDDRGDQHSFDHRTGPLGRPDHRVPDLGGGHRPDQHLGVGQRRHQLRQFDAPAVEVGPDAEHHP